MSYYYLWYMERDMAFHFAGRFNSLQEAKDYAKKRKFEYLYQVFDKNGKKIFQKGIDIQF